MEEIKSKAHEDELNKAVEEIHETPHKKIPVPKPEKKSNNDKTKNYG